MPPSRIKKSRHYKICNSISCPQQKQDKPRIVVVGSLHMDITVKTEKIPRIGETVLGDTYLMSPGGKGANQAVAAAKLGADVIIIGRVGADAFGKELIRSVKENGVDTRYIVEDEERHNGVAAVIVDERGNNVIAVASGADMRCCTGDIEKAEEAIKSSDVVLIQMEIPLSVVECTIDTAYEEGVNAILNLAPAQQLTDDLLRKISVLIANAEEAQRIGGKPVRDSASAKVVAKDILERGVESVIITLGKKGAVVATREETAYIEGIDVNTVDDTGAGDAFCAALAVAICHGMNLKQAVLYSNFAGALATTKIGAQQALPTAKELQDFIRNRGTN